VGVTHRSDTRKRKRKPAAMPSSIARNQNTPIMTHLKQNKQASAFLKGAAAMLLASCSWALPAVAADDAMAELLGTLRQRGTISEAEYQRMKPQAEKQAAAASSALNRDALKKDWFGKMSIRGYVQTRYTHVFGSGVDNAGTLLNSPTETNISERDTLLMRRARMIFSGDVHEHLFLYAQVDWQAGAGTSITEAAPSGLQTRDMYGDISLDHDKEHRIRIGVSKVPYGFVNLQSSQNRLSIERPEALNSAVEGERDLGVYYMWADKTARERFRELIKLGLKGSGDYGVFTAGVYNGQGLNRYDSNRNLHTVVRLAYPFQLDNGQFFELGLSGYQGQFAPNNSVDKTNSASLTSTGTLGAGRSFMDRRAAANFVWYPQPFGMELEWTVGEGPETKVRYDSMGRGTTIARTNSPFVGGINRDVTVESLHGGYVLLNYKADTDIGTFYPFTRWSYFDGARKFVQNAPTQRVNEVDFGVEYSPWPCFEIALVYTRTIERTNTSQSSATLVNGASSVYTLAKDVDRITCQLQYNF
jgi:hypothetical protein